VFSAVLVLICANALLYTVKTANPLMAADEWVFVDALVRKAVDGDLTVGDLFMKRSAVDHAQPLRKLVLLFHYKYFDLDFGIEAIIGVLAAFANLGLLWLIAMRALRSSVAALPSPQPTLPDASLPAWSGAMALLGFAAIAAVYLSLNSPVVFGWPLLTLAYTSHFFVLMFIGLAWRGYRRATVPALGLLALGALLLDAVSDDTGLIATVAVALALLLAGKRDRRMRQAGSAAAVALAAFAIYKPVFAWLTRDVVVAGAEPSARLQDMLASLAAHPVEMLSSLRVPLTASVAHRLQLHHWLARDTAGIELAIAAVLALAHAWFWWKAWQGRRNVAAFSATALMLLFYGLVAGTLLVRVSMHGGDYFWQPRYLLIYQFNLVALLLMAIAQLPPSGREPRAAAERSIDDAGTGIGKSGRALFAVGALLLLLLQVPFSVESWSAVGYRSIHQQRMALRFGDMADPRAKAVACARDREHCEGISWRMDLVRFLKAQHLSVFSPRFRARNRLYTDPRQLPD
jgi:hypothetical protein